MFFTPISCERGIRLLWISCHKALIELCFVRHKNEILGIAFRFSMFTGYSKMPSSVATYLHIVSRFILSRRDQDIEG